MTRSKGVIRLVLKENSGYGERIQVTLGLNVLRLGFWNFYNLLSQSMVFQFPLAVLVVALCSAGRWRDICSSDRGLRKQIDIVDDIYSSSMYFASVTCWSSSVRSMIVSNPESHDHRGRKTATERYPNLSKRSEVAFVTVHW